MSWMTNHFHAILKWHKMHPIVKYILPQEVDAITQGRFGFSCYCIVDAQKDVSSCDK